MCVIKIGDSDWCRPFLSRWQTGRHDIVRIPSPHRVDKLFFFAKFHDFSRSFVLFLQIEIWKIRPAYISQVKK